MNEHMETNKRMEEQTSVLRKDDDRKMRSIKELFHDHQSSCFLAGGPASDYDVGVVSAV